MIGDEYFHFDEKGRAFTGRSATYRLGDPVTVELVEAAPVAGALRFRLVHAGHAGHPERTERTRHKPKEQRKIAPGGRPSSAKRSKKQRGKKR
jgi:ribonuclease R